MKNYLFSIYIYSYSCNLFRVAILLTFRATLIDALFVLSQLPDWTHYFVNWRSTSNHESFLNGAVKSEISSNVSLLSSCRRSGKIAFLLIVNISFCFKDIPAFGTCKRNTLWCNLCAYKLKKISKMRIYPALILHSAVYRFYYPTSGTCQHNLCRTFSISRWSTGIPSDQSETFQNFAVHKKKS